MGHAAPADEGRAHRALQSRSAWRDAATVGRRASTESQCRRRQVVCPGAAEQPVTLAPARCPLRSGTRPTLNTVPRGKPSTVIPSRALARAAHLDQPACRPCRGSRTSRITCVVERHEHDLEVTAVRG